MPIRLEIEDRIRVDQDLSHVAISDREVTELMSSFRRFGYFRNDIDSGHFYFSSEASAIFGLPDSTGPVDLRDLLRSLEKEDAEVFETLAETAARTRQTVHAIFKVNRPDLLEPRFVRIVGKHRLRNEQPELVGVIYEFFAAVTTIGTGPEPAGGD